MTTQEKNIMLAEFMGGEYKDYSFDDEMPFGMHNSWEWLMPVLKKCGDIGGSYEYETTGRNKFEDIFYIDNMWSEFMQGDIRSVYERVVEFVIWYNEENRNDD